ncbi:unnamed protein product [Cyclocybe aegerita]|uniref:F-box domain-containing protein n=1 Tax=Cyclocybe aegerita TaxID=1973307 RepID=A0A8S0WRL7_CYCAE|nr:unnamed protein product [Cyclocybe aegerita]
MVMTSDTERRKVPPRTQSASPILQISPDILCLIITSLASSEDERNPRFLDTLRLLSTVCHDWRKAIHIFDDLWGRFLDVTKGSSSWKVIHLARTQSAPLHLLTSRQLESTDTESCEFVRMLLATKAFRIHVIAFDLVEVAGIKDFWGHLSHQPFPNLRYFDVVTLDEYDDATKPRPFSFFNKQAPKLEHFIVRGCFLAPWLNAEIFSNLRTLDMADSYWNHGYSLQMWLCALTHMQRLEELSLNDAFLDVEGQQLEKMTPGLQSCPLVRLPRLRKLRLWQCLFASTVVLSKIVPEVGCSVEVLVHVQPNSIPKAGKSDTLMASLYSEYLSTAAICWGKQRPTRCFIQMYYYKYRFLLLAPVGESTDEILLDLKVAWEPEDEGYNESGFHRVLWEMGFIFSRFSTSLLASVTPTGSLMGDPLVAFMQKFPNVREICGSPDSLAVVKRLLRISINTDRRGKPLPCPLLERMTTCSDACQRVGQSLVWYKDRQECTKQGIRRREGS